jgi:hypothetical protein
LTIKFTWRTHIAQDRNWSCRGGGETASAPNAVQQTSFLKFFQDWRCRSRDSLRAVAAQDFGMNARDFLARMRFRISDAGSGARNTP